MKLITRGLFNIQVIENIADGKTRPMAESEMVQFEELIEAVGEQIKPKVILDREPDVVKQVT